MSALSCVIGNYTLEIKRLCAKDKERDNNVLRSQPCSARPVVWNRGLGVCHLPAHSRADHHLQRVGVQRDLELVHAGHLSGSRPADDHPSPRAFAGHLGLHQPPPWQE